MFKKHTWMYVGLLMALMLVFAVPVLAQMDGPTVEVSDQPIKNGTVTIARVVAPELGWIVIHADKDGKPGPILGKTQVQAGENLNVVVAIDTANATPRLHAMLHVDRGTAGTFEFPNGPDVPVKVGDKVVNVPFNTVTVLPTTGGEGFPLGYLILIAGGAAVLLGFGLRRYSSAREVT